MQGFNQRLYKTNDDIYTLILQIKLDIPKNHVNMTTFIFYSVLAATNGYR